jgi:hypothetical protein
MPKAAKDRGVKFGSGQDPTKGGRPKKSVNFVTAQLKAEGYEAPTVSEIKDFYLTCLGLDELRLIELESDLTVPKFQRIVAKMVIHGQGLEVIEKMIDRSIGKAAQSIELQGNKDKPLTPTNIQVILGGMPKKE